MFELFFRKFNDSDAISRFFTHYEEKVFPYKPSKKSVRQTGWTDDSPNWKHCDELYGFHENLFSAKEEKISLVPMVLEEIDGESLSV